MAHYLVTGGAGFIGSHLVELLLAAGHRITVIDNFSTGSRGNLPAHSELTIVARDLLALTREHLAGPFDAVAHLAALPSVNESWTQLARAHAINLTGTVRAIELARELNIPRLVFASSAAVYGDTDVIPMEEMQRLRPASPYGLQKKSSEEYGRLLAGRHFTFIALRFFNVFGPRQVANSPYSGVITKFVQSMRENQPVTIFGSGGQTRDFVYVNDIVSGIAHALAASGLDPFTACNLGSATAVSIRQLATALRAFFPAWTRPVQEGPARPGDIVHSVADISVAQRLLSYRPRYTLESGLAEMLALAK
jgi:UDP-glucose 4-epimerase